MGCRGAPVRVIVVDTGPIVAAANPKDDFHRPCVDLLQSFPGPLLLPAPLLAEVGYMLGFPCGGQG